MTTTLITHPDCLNHITPDGHPERVARLAAILQVLDADDFDELVRLDADLGTEDQILRAHPQDHIEAIKAAAPTSNLISLDSDTHMSPGSLTAAMRGVGAICQAVDLVMSGQSRNAFCAMRPPGHHAETRTPMGFCLFGNVVIGAKHALDYHGLSRVAIIDFDVHHGNGTQDLVWGDPRIFFNSSHQMPLYPGSGATSETGAAGNILNIPLPPNAGGVELRAVYKEQVLPRLRAHRPEMIFISAGFDAHADDPLANLNFQEEDFAWATDQISRVAEECCDGKVVSTLEGGYDLRALAASTAAHIKVLMEYCA